MVPVEHSSRSRIVWWFLGLVAILVGSYFGWQHFTAKGADVALPSKATTVAPPVPVTVATAERVDFPVYLNGLGTVQPFNTVTVRAALMGRSPRSSFGRDAW